MSEPKVASHKAASLIEEMQRSVIFLQRVTVTLAAANDGIDLSAYQYEVGTASWVPKPQPEEVA